MLVKSYRAITFISFTFFSLLLSLAKGSTSISLYQLLFHPDPTLTAIFSLRLTRTICAFVSGGLLALAGSFMQLLLQNPLADPYVLGISGGAAFFTLLVMLLGLSDYWLVGGAWAGSLLTIALVLLLSAKQRFHPNTLLLSGIALACGFSAGISLLLLLSPNTSLPSMLFWLTGDLSGARFPVIGILSLTFGFIVCYFLAPGLNILGRGDHQALALGLNIKKYRLALYLLSSFFTAIAVMMAGCIGFIGLIVPHFARRLTGYDHRLCLPVSILLGGSLLTLADTGARLLLSPQQLPVGIIMVVIGVPVFIGLLQR